MPASTVGSVFQSLPPATALSQQWDINCTTAFVIFYGTWLTADACLCVISLQDGGQLSALGVFRVNSWESNLNSHTVCGGSLPEYSEYSLTPRTRLFSLVDYNSPHYAPFHLIYFSLFNRLPGALPAPQSLWSFRKKTSATVDIHDELRVRLFLWSAGWRRSEAVLHGPSRSPGSVVTGGCGGRMMSVYNTLWSSDEAPHARMKHTRAKPVQTHTS